MQLEDLADTTQCKQSIWQRKRQKKSLNRLKTIQDCLRNALLIMVYAGQPWYGLCSKYKRD